MSDTIPITCLNDVLPFLGKVVAYTSTSYYYAKHDLGLRFAIVSPFFSKWMGEEEGPNMTVLYAETEVPSTTALVTSELERGKTAMREATDAELEQLQADGTRGTSDDLKMIAEELGYRKDPTRRPPGNSDHAWSLLTMDERDSVRVMAKFITEHSPTSLHYMVKDREPWIVTFKWTLNKEFLESSSSPSLEESTFQAGGAAVLWIINAL